MASLQYQGKTYFQVRGKWVDNQSRAVAKDLELKLQSAYAEKMEAVKKEANQSRVQRMKEQEATAQRSVAQRTGSKRSLQQIYGIQTIRPRKKDETVTSIHKKTVSQPQLLSVELTEDQRHALEILESGANVFLSGEAGTGKSFVLNTFIQKNQNKNMIVCAPTGIAAINVGGATLHRVFQAPLRITRPGEYHKKPEEALVKADIIIIDEISMCRFDLFEYVIRTVYQAERIRQEKENVEAMSRGELPRLFAPKQIIVVGDFYQLPPVITPSDKEILYEYWEGSQIGDGFAFQSQVWQELQFENVVLKEVVRQRGNAEYIQNLNKIRIGDESGIAWFNENVEKEPLAESIYLCATNKAADAINRQESEKLEKEAVVYHAQIKGTVTLGDKMTQDDLELKEGMQVMTLVNHKEEGYQNGSIGKIIRLGADSVEVRLETGKLVTVRPYTWEIIGYEIRQEKLERVVLGSFKQIPLKVAYAITIHKSQGQTYQSANISPDCFADGQLYVALSRVSSLEGMRLEHEISSRALRTSRAVRYFYQQIMIEAE